MVELETERLLLRQWRQEDFEVYAAYYADPELARFIGGVCDRPTAWRRLAAEVGHWTLRGFGFWAVEERADGKRADGKRAGGKLVGCVGLWRPEGWPELELGYWLLPAGQGKGYATEAGLRAREFAYDELGKETLVSYIHPDNEPSKRVAERLGARHETTLELSSFGPHCVYRHPGPRASSNS